MFKIKTASLVLRDIAAADGEVLHSQRSDPTVTRCVDYIRSDNEAESRDWLQGTMQHHSLSSRLSNTLSIVRRSDEQVLGWIGIGQASEEGKGVLEKVGLRQVLRAEGGEDR